jgi:hypothetical protein
VEENCNRKAGGIGVRKPSIIGIVILAIAACHGGPEAQAACTHRSVPGITGTERLINAGWTTDETDKLVSLLSSFANKVCPEPQFFDIDRVNHGPSVSRYTFRITSETKRRYQVTALLLDIHHMRLTVRSTSGKILYRSGTVQHD